MFTVHTTQYIATNQAKGRIYHTNDLQCLPLLIQCYNSDMESSCCAGEDLEWPISTNDSCFQLPSGHGDLYTADGDLFSASFLALRIDTPNGIKNLRGDKSTLTGTESHSPVECLARTNLLRHGVVLQVLQYDEIRRRSVETIRRQTLLRHKHDAIC